MERVTSEWLITKIIFNESEDSTSKRNSSLEITSAGFNNSDGSLSVRADFYTGIHKYPNINFYLKTACLLDRFNKEPFEIEVNKLIYVGVFNGHFYEYSIL